MSMKRTPPEEPEEGTALLLPQLRGVVKQQAAGVEGFIVIIGLQACRIIWLAPSPSQSVHIAGYAAELVQPEACDTNHTSGNEPRQASDALLMVAERMWW